jgi:putative ABC transport system ATP-binding protein
MSFLEVDRVSKQYRVGGAEPLKALDDVNFTANAGEWIAIMGPSGSGKTTLLNILGCLDQPSAGAVRIASTDIAQLGRADLVRFRAETVGLIFQQYHLIPHLSAIENVMLAQYFHSMTDESEARRALDHVGLADRARHLPSQLSGGEQQRVAIARALVNDPKIILADEPTGNLDAANQQIVLDLLNGLHAQGRTILLVTHDERVGRCADRRINLDHGRIVETLVFTAEENEDFDEILEELWMRRESAMHHEGTHFTDVQRQRLYATMSRIGLLRVAGKEVGFTDQGETRARSVIRRHRLAERLFMDVLFIRDDAAVESNACTFEHILSPEVTDRICTFLGHPKTCPHGSPIPPGECCGNGAHSAVPRPLPVRSEH